MDFSTEFPDYFEGGLERTQGLKDNRNLLDLSLLWQVLEKHKNENKGKDALSVDRFHSTTWELVVIQVVGF